MNKFDELMLSIYESCEDGYISESARDEMLDIVVQEKLSGTGEIIAAAATPIAGRYAGSLIGKTIAKHTKSKPMKEIEKEINKIKFEIKRLKTLPPNEGNKIRIDNLDRHLKDLYKIYNMRSNQHIKNVSTLSGIAGLAAGAGSVYLSQKARANKQLRDMRDKQMNSLKRKK